MSSAEKAERGAMVISFDFELLWGVRDIYSSNDPYINRVIQEAKVIPRMLELLGEFEAAATWAAVGAIFAQSRSELKRFSPHIKPQYKEVRLDPYQEVLGEDERDDPLHYGYSLIQKIQRTNRQEIATHTFSHYYCLEAGQNSEAFAADLDSALKLARERGIQIRSIVFPRNQHNQDYDNILLERGIICYRGTEQHPAYAAEGRNKSRMPYKRLYRLVDSHIPLSGSHLIPWESVVEESGLCNVAASRYLRPTDNSVSILSALRLKRIVNAMEEAARTRKVFHLWTHPQDFGSEPEESIKVLRLVLENFKRLEKQYGMLSLGMLETAAMAQEIRRLQKEGKDNGDRAF